MTRLNPRHVFALLIVATAALYLTLVRTPGLAWDDDFNIFANPFFRSGDWAEFWRRPYYGLYVPITSLVWQILFTAGGGEAWPFRVLNVALHVLNVALVFAGLNAFARARGWGSRWPAVLGAAVFALHPLQVGTVAWISGGRDLLAAFFALAALGLVARGRPALATLGFALAVLSKPSAVAWLAVVLVLRPLTREPRRPIWFAAWVGLAGVVTWVTMNAQEGHLPEIAWWQRPWLVGDAFAHYAVRLVNQAPLAVNYARTPAVVLGGPAWPALLGLACLAIVTAVGPCRAFARAFAVLLLPVSGLVSFGYQEISGVADHYAYLPLAAFAGAVAELASRARSRTVVRVVGVAAVLKLALFVRTDVERLAVWRSNAALFGDMASSAPLSYPTALGASNVACAERGDFDAGLRWTEVALAAKPRDPRALANQAYCLLHAKRFAATAALAPRIDELDRDGAARLEPTGFASLLASVGTARIELGEFGEGFRLLCAAERLRPDDPNHRQNLAAGREILRRRGLPAECDR